MRFSTLTSHYCKMAELALEVRDCDSTIDLLLLVPSLGFFYWKHHKGFVGFMSYAFYESIYALRSALCCTTVILEWSHLLFNNRAEQSLPSPEFHSAFRAATWWFSQANKRIPWKCDKCQIWWENLTNKTNSQQPITLVRYQKAKKFCSHTNQSNIFEHDSCIWTWKKRNQQPQEQHKTSFVAGREKNTTVLKKAIGRKWKNLGGEWECERNVAAFFPLPACTLAVRRRRESCWESFTVWELFCSEVQRILKQLILPRSPSQLNT